MNQWWLFPVAPALAFATDLLLGDPRRLPHPVRMIGWCIRVLEKLLRSFLKGPQAKRERASGMILVFLVAGGAYLISAAALQVAGWVSPFLELAVATYLIYVCISVKDMGRHIRAVDGALLQKNLPLARARVSLLVSRDCAAMGAGEVAGAALESMFENTADGVAAPLFYAALGGPALAILFKAVSTMDSMVGYKNERYLHFGWAAARLDDVLVFIPARMCAYLFLATGLFQGDCRRRVATILKEDRRKHDSPNSAWPEAAAAAVLNLRLGGPAIYGGVTVDRLHLNATGRAPGPHDLRRGLTLFYRTSVLTWVVALFLAGAVALIRGLLW
jgi:adenosylcobinamide-phosphate synthase